MLKRMKAVNADFINEMGVIEKNGKSIIYDVIQLYSFEKQNIT